MSTPNVSVILPILGESLHLAESIHSILHQSYKKFELLILDDGNSESTTAHLNDVDNADPRLRLIKNSASGDLTLGYDWNAAAKLANGEYLAVARVGDTSARNRLAWQVEYLSQNQDVDFVGGAVRKLNKRGNLVKIESMAEDPSGRRIRKGLLRNKRVLYHRTLMFRKSAFDSLDGYDDLSLASEWEFLIRASRHHRIDNLPEPLVDSRVLPARRGERNFQALERLLRVTILARERARLTQQLFTDTQDKDE